MRDSRRHLGAHRPPGRTDLGRFMSADSIVPGAHNPQVLNRYSYVVNNPVRYVDPTGYCHQEVSADQICKAVHDLPPPAPAVYVAELKAQTVLSAVFRPSRGPKLPIPVIGWRWWPVVEARTYPVLPGQIPATVVVMVVPASLEYADFGRQMLNATLRADFVRQ